MDLDRRAPDKTNGSSLILGNTGQGKSYLLKLLLCNVREVGKNVIALDSEHELEDLCGHLGGCFLDLLSGQYRINLLEPRRWDDAASRRIRTRRRHSAVRFWPSTSPSSGTSSGSIRDSIHRTLIHWN